MIILCVGENVLVVLWFLTGNHEERTQNNIKFSMKLKTDFTEEVTKTNIWGWLAITYTSLWLI